ncbi:MAG: hypothetical protein JRN57_00360 [Nitrososphaerota archaeon]|nr:hypothetical protein [Nitrososphaerota archaeon]
MDARNVTIAGIWAFAIVWLVGSFALEADLSFALLIFFVSMAVSVGLAMTQRASATAPKQTP